MALAVVGLPAARVTRRHAWTHGKWGWPAQDFFEDFLEDGRLDSRPANSAGPTVGSLCADLLLPPRGVRTVTFLLGWHFPNRRGWSSVNGEDGPPEIVGNYYATRFSDAWDVIARAAPRLAALERKTVEFVRSVVESDLPPILSESALANLVPLRSQTSFRTADGKFYGWEGCGDHEGKSPGSCTHVWLYDGATHRLFGSLARSMRETELLDCTRDDGLIFMRCPLPRKAPAWTAAAADGQCGVILRFLREYRACGNRAWLARLWPRARAAMEFCWIPGGWDADRDGLMEGPQHNTMDVEYCGPNPQVASWYLAALLAAAELARAAADPAFAAECERLYASGRTRLNALFNGEFYPQKVVPLAPGARPPAGLSNLVPDGNDLANPIFQLGPACSIDQLAALPYACESGLGDLVGAARARVVLRGILRHNRRPNLRHHLNLRRTMALGEEAGVLLATWPHGGRPQRPFPYATECWTGCEHLLAAALLWCGLEKEGLRVIGDIRARHAGHNRNPFNEYEAGSHYARTLSAWATLAAYTRHTYNAQTGDFTVAGRPGNYPWFTGDSYGRYTLSPRGKFTLHLDGGTPLTISLITAGERRHRFRSQVTLRRARPIAVNLREL